MCAKNPVNVFGSFLDIRQNAKWPHFYPVSKTAEGQTYFSERDRDRKRAKCDKADKHRRRSQQDHDIDGKYVNASLKCRVAQSAP